MVLTTTRRLGTPVEKRGPVGGGEVWPDQIEFRDVAVVGAVTKQDDDEQIVASDLFADLGEDLANVLGAAGLSRLDGFVDEDSDIGRLEAIAIDQRGLKP